jgi:hypothetical protein
MCSLSKSLRFALMALLVGVCVAETASARERGGRRSRKSSGGGYSSNSDYPQPTLAPVPTPTPTPAPTNAPQPNTPLPTPAEVLPNPVFTNTGSVDLVLEDLKMSAEATSVAGPAYAVRFRNQGTLPAGKFAVLVAVSVDGKLTQDAPRGAIEMPLLSPGESREVILRLPATAMKPNAAGQSFHHLVVMIDPLDSVRELDESNNTAVVDAI